MADKNVEIKIVTSANTQGAEKTAQALNDVKTQATELASPVAESSKELTAQALNDVKTQATELASPVAESSKELDGLGKTTDQVSKKKTFFGMKLNELKKSLKELAHQIPGLGYAFLALKNPITIAAATIGGAMAYLIQLHLDYAKQAGESANEVADFYNSYKESVGMAARASDEHASKLKSIGDQAKTATEMLQELNRETERQGSAEERVLSLKKEVDIAEADAGISDPKKLAERKRQIELQYIKDVGNLKRNQEDRKVADTKKALDYATTTEATSKAKIPTQEKAINDRERIVKTLEEQQKKSEENLKKLNEKAESQKYWDEMISPYQLSDAPHVLARKNEIKKTENQVDEQQRIIDDRRKAIEHQKSILEQQKADHEMTVETATQATKDKTKLSRELPTLEQHAFENKNALTYEGQVKSQIVDLETNKNVRDINKRETDKQERDREQRANKIIQEFDKYAPKGQDLIGLTVDQIRGKMDAASIATANALIRLLNTVDAHEKRLNQAESRNLKGR